MELDLAQQRQQAHTFLDVLPAEKLVAVHTLLEVLIEPLSRALAMAPMDDDELNSATIASIERASASIDRGEGIPHEEILREFGFQ